MQTTLALLANSLLIFLLDTRMNKIFLGTAHPGKFSDVVEPIIDTSIKLPKRLKEVLSLKKRSVILKNNYTEFYDYLIQTFQ